MLIYKISIVTKLLLALLIAFPSLSLAQEKGQLNIINNVNSALDAASILANNLDRNMGGISSSNLVLALEDAANAGEPIAMWRLGIMYENGDGVKKDMAKAFGYFSRLANDYSDTPRNSLQADIVAKSFVKLGTYYRDGLPDAGINKNSKTFVTLLMHAASYFGDAEAQYRVGLLFLDEDNLGYKPLQSMRWLLLAAHKGHVGAQARLGKLLFDGEGVESQPVEGLKWLQLARQGALGTLDERWINEMADEVLLRASQEQIIAASLAISSFNSQVSGN